MKRDIIIRKRAERNLEEAFDWYEKQRVGLGLEFLLCVDATIQAVVKNPLLFQIRHKNIKMFYCINNKTNTLTNKNNKKSRKTFICQTTSLNVASQF